MTLLKFEVAVASSHGVGESDRVWFPKWLRRYAMTFPQGLVNDLAVNRDTTLQFSRMLLESGAPAWQRWQAVRSLECYRDLVLGRSEPDLPSIIEKLPQLGKQERNLDLEVPPKEEELAIIACCRGEGLSEHSEPGSVQFVIFYQCADEKGEGFESLVRLKAPAPLPRSLGQGHLCW